MNEADKWAHIETWRQFGVEFCIEVKRHFARPRMGHSDGGHRWCVYAYIYPTHPHFCKFSGDDMCQDATRAMPLHWGSSFLEWHAAADGTITSVQVGADYAHIDDDRFTHMSIREQAGQVFDDAVQLFDWLTEAGNGAVNKSDAGQENTEGAGDD